MRSTRDAVVFVAAISLVLILVVGGAASFAYLLNRPALAHDLCSLPVNPWWLIYRDPGPKDAAQPFVIIAAGILAAALGIAFSLRAHGLYRQSRTPVLPYLLLFFLTLGIECLRGPTAALYAADRSVAAILPLTRAVYWGRFVGLLALLLCSLYCMDLKYQHVYVLGGGSLLVAFAMAASIPVDRTTFLAQFLWKLGDEQGVWFVDLAIAGLILLTTIGAAALKRESRFLFLSGGLLLLLAARELLFFNVKALPLAAGAAALAAGAVLSLRSLAAIYRKT